jgi:hypothetical protein
MALNNLTKFEQKSAPDENFSQDFEPKQPEKPWERQKNEPANWYMRFRRYLEMGTKRSLQAAITSEPASPKAIKGTKGHQNLTDVSVPGSWKRASKLWNWVARAKAYDEHIQETQAFVMRKAACSQEYSSRAWRIMELNFLAKALKDSINPGLETKEMLAIVGRIQSIFHDIEAEVAKLGMENEADAEVLITFMKQRAKS